MSKKDSSKELKRLTFDSIRLEEWSKLMNMTRKRVKQCHSLFKAVAIPQKIEDFDELINFQQTGEFPSAKVQRSQINKIKRLYVWMMSALYYDELDEDTYNAFYEQLDRLCVVFPYLCDPLIELGIYEVSKTN